MFAEYVETPIGVDDFDNEAWQRCRPVRIAHEWSGQAAPVERHAEVRICWSDEALHVRFVGNQHEPLVVSDRKSTRLNSSHGYISYAVFCLKKKKKRKKVHEH